MQSISSQIIENEAKKIGFKTKIISDKYDIFYIKKDNNKILFKNIDCGLNNSLSIKFSRQKDLTYFMLGENNIKVPKSIYINKTTKQIESLIKKEGLSFPLVVKPSIGSHGDGVSVNIKNKKELDTAINKALKYDKKIIIQEFFKGNDYRVFCVNNKVIAVMKRIPAYIIGNGKDSIKSLIKKENSKKERGIGHEKGLTKILVDKDVLKQLKTLNIDINYIPKNKETIFLRKNANLSTGGVSVDETDNINPEIKKICEKASKILGLKICGIDYLSENISKPLSQQKGGIIEINHTPGLRGHHFPYKGKPRNVAKEILKLAFSE